MDGRGGLRWDEARGDAHVRVVIRDGADGREVGGWAHWPGRVEEPSEPVGVHRGGMVGGDRDLLVAARHAVLAGHSGGRDDDVPAVASEVDVLAWYLPRPLLALACVEEVGVQPA